MRIPFKAVGSSVVLLATFGFPSQAQETTKSSHHAHSAAVTPKEANVIDGSVTPEAISDYKAWEVFIHGCAIPDNAAEAAKADIRSRFSGAKLSRADEDVVMKALHDYHRSVQIGEASRQKMTDADLQKSFTSRVLVAQQQCRDRMTPSGYKALTEYVKGLKRYIKVYWPTTTN